VIALLSAPLAALALKFTAPEYFSLLIMGLIAAVVLAHGSPFKAIAMIVMGVLVGLVGIDVNSGVPRLTFGIPDIADGMDFVPVVVGLFGIGEVIANLGVPRTAAFWWGDQNLMPTWPDLKARPPCYGERAWGRCSGSSPAAARRCPRSRRTLWKRRCRGTRSASGPASSRVSPRPRRRITPAPRPVSSHS
jgi:hypothetical protein